MQEPPGVVASEEEIDDLQNTVPRSGPVPIPEGFAGPPVSPSSGGNTPPAASTPPSVSEHERWRIGEPTGTAGPTTPPSGVSKVTPPTVMPPRRSGGRAGRVVAIAAAAIIVLAAAVGATVLVTSKKTGSPGGNKPAVHPVSQAQPSAKSYTSFQAEYAALKNSIAEITTVGCDGNNYVGTGFVIDAHHIVTAGHVVEGAQSMTVTVSGGQPLPTQIIGLDTSGDVALLSSDSALPGPYVPLSISQPAVGQRVAAIGFPLAGGLTMTQGSVSALNATINVNNTNLAGLVQTDTALNPGNSGGPLVALNGQATGIVDALNTQANATGYAIDPQYAASEVTHWIQSPESHPLPLCSAPDPYASVAVSPGSGSSNSAGESAAASSVDSILQESASARSTVVSATQAVENCNADPNTEAQVMQGAISSRESALSELASVDSSSLPDGSAIINDLNAALADSDQADGDFVAWMNDVEGDSCPYPTTSDPNFESATAASAQADAAKQAFLALWNPIAAQFNLTQYDPTQI
jgi:trypsin-like peptidase